MKKPKVKFVKRANMWCLTYWNENNEQKQEWFRDEREARKKYLLKGREQKFKNSKT